MRSGLMMRGRIALVTMICVLAYTSAAVAQMNYYWQGGSGTWNTSAASWVSGGTTGSGGAWQNGGIANIGYLITSGSGGTNGSDGPGSYYSWTPAGGTAAAVPSPPAITLVDANNNPVAISANQVVFGQNTSTPTNAKNSQYQISGGTLNLGDGVHPGNINLDLTDPASFGPFQAQISSNIVVNSGTGALSFTVGTPNLSTSSYSTYLFLSGSNSFSSAIVGGAPVKGTNVNALVFTNTQSVNFNGQVPNITLGNNGAVDDLAGDNSVMNLGTITLNPTAGNTASGSYVRNLTDYGYYGTSKGRIGAGEYTAGAPNPPYSPGTVPGYQFPNLNVGAITGQGDVMFTTGAQNDGRGVITVTATSSYTGDTFFNSSSCRYYGPNDTGDSGGMAILRIGVSNALPIGTNLIFGHQPDPSNPTPNGAANSGALDLNGCYQQLSSITTIAAVVPPTTNDYHGGVTNFASTQGTLAIFNDPSPTGTNLPTIEAQLHGIIGKTVLDGTNRPTSSQYSNDNICLQLLSGNNGTLTLGLEQAGESPPGNSIAQANTYSGGTTICGGALFAANGNTYWDGTHGVMNDGHGNIATSASASVLNSATGTGPVVVNQGGTLGGSIPGGAIGMPGTGPVTINNGGYLLPGGGYYNDSTGQGAASYVNEANASITAVDPRFHATAGAPLKVLGDLNLNNGANVNYNFDPTGMDLIEVGGTLNLSGTVNLNLNTSTVAGTGTLFNDMPVFDLSSPTAITGGTANLICANNPNVTFAQNGSEIDMVVPGAPTLSHWTGTIATGGTATWDTGMTANFIAGGVARNFNATDAVVFNDFGANTIIAVAAAGVSPSAMLLQNSASTYTFTGGPILSGNVTINGGGTVVFSNTNSYSGTTQIQNGSTLVVNSPQALPAGGAVNIVDKAVLQLNYTDSGSGTYNGTINFWPGSLGTGATPTINVSGTYSVTLAGGLVSNGPAGLQAGLTKAGAGTLVLTDAVDSNNSGPTYINAGVVEVTSTYNFGDPGQSYSALGSGDMFIQNSGSTFWLNNVHIGVNQTQNVSDPLGFLDIYTLGIVKGTGNSSFGRSNISAVLKYDAVDGVYDPGNFTLETGTSSSDVLALQNEVEQFDPNYSNNHYVNYVTGAGSAATNASYVMTCKIAGSGTVMLQSGGVSSTSVFGGVWSVNSGILQIGPFVGTALAVTTTAAGDWSGASGEVFNALGFKTATTIGTSSAGNPDLPNPVTVNKGGMLAIANDQTNGNPNATLNPANPTPPYLRNPVTLSGGSLAASGAEVTWNSTGSSQGLITQLNAAVVARLGGSFSTSSTSTILTYDPHGLALDSSGNPISADGLARTVELVGGSRVLSNSSAGLPLPAGQNSLTLTYSTSWAGDLVIASSGTVGGTFNIKRSGGTVSVTSGAMMTIQPNSTVNISNDDSSTLAMSLSGTSYGYMVSGTGGILPTLNNVLSANGHSVAIANSGTFNVNAGTQTVGAITGIGSFNVTGTATASAPSIVQSSASVASGATLNLTGPGALATGPALNNSGQLNVTGGSHTMATVGALTLDASGNQTLPTLGTTTVGTGARLSAAQVYQNTININSGATVVLTGSNINVAPYYTSAASSVNIAGGLGAWTGKLDVGQSGIYIPSSGSATFVDQIKQGAGASLDGTPTWTGTGGITSSAAASNASTYAVGYRDLGNGVTQVAYTVAGDALLVGGVTPADRQFVSGSYLGNQNATWATGDFNYDGRCDVYDRAIERRNEGISLDPPAGPMVQTAVRPSTAGSSTASGVPAVQYNDVTGLLTLDNAGPNYFSNLDSLAIGMASTKGVVQNGLTDDLRLEFGDSLQWAQSNAGGSDYLPTGVYTLAQLPAGLTSADFGSYEGGLGDTSGAVAFFAGNGSQTSAAVEIVPEPSSLALCAAAVAAVGGLLRWRRIRRSQCSLRGAAFLVVLLAGGFIACPRQAPAAVVDYNPLSGLLTLDDSGGNFDPALDNFTVYLQNVSASPLSISGSWSVFTQDTRRAQDYSWGSGTGGVYGSYSLAPVVYSLAQLAPGLGNSDFGYNGGSGFNFGSGDALGSVSLGDSGGQTVSDYVRLVQTVPSEVDWTGPANNSWTTATNWTVSGGSTQRVPIAGDTPTFSNPALAGTVSLNGSQSVGSLWFNSSNSYTIAPGSGGTLTLSNTASIWINAGLHTISAPLALTSGGSLTVNAEPAGDVAATSTGLTVSGAISGMGTLMKIGPGILFLSNTNNTYNGNTLITGGTLSAAGGGSLSASGSVTISNATLDFSGPGTFARGISLSGSGANTIQADAGIMTLSGAISGSGGLTKAGPGTLALGNTGNSYSGGTNVSSGTLQLQAATALSSSTAAVTVAGGAALDLNGYSPWLANISGSGAVTNSSLSNTSTLSAAYVGGAASYAAAIQDGAGHIALSVPAGGLLTLSNSANTFSGGSSVSGGTLSIWADGNLGGAASGVSLNNGTLLLGGTGNFTLASGRAISLAGSSSISVVAGQSATIAGLLSGGTLTKSGNGLLSLTGTNNNYSGGTVINGGVLAAANDSSLGASGVTINNATFQVGGGTSNRSLTLAGQNAFLQVKSGTYTEAGLVSGLTSLTKTGSGTLVLTNSSNAYGFSSINLQAGTLLVNDPTGYSLGQGTGTINVTGGTLEGSGTILQQVKILSGTLLAGNSNTMGTMTFQTGLQITNGTTWTVKIDGSGHSDSLDFGYTKGVTAANSSLTVSSGSPTLVVTGTPLPETGISYPIVTHDRGTTVLTNIQVQAPVGFVGTLTAGSPQNDTVGPYHNINLTFSGPTQWNQPGGGSWNVGGNWNGGVPSSGTVLGAVALFGTNGNGTVSLPASQVTLINALVFANSTSSYTLSAGSGGSAEFVNLSAANGANEGTAAVEVISGQHTIAANAQLAATLDVSTLDRSAAMTFSGALSGSGGLVASGSGSLLLAGDNSFSGGTTVNGGTLYLTSGPSLPSNSSLAVGAGGTVIFDPTAVIGGNVAGQSVSLPSTVSPVPEPGTLATLAVAAICCLAVRTLRRSRAGRFPVR